MSLNKFKDFNLGFDLNLEIGCDNLKLRHLIVTEPIDILQVNNLTVNDNLTIVCNDLSTYNLTTPNNGNLGDILSSDGAGNTLWVPQSTPPPLSGIVYSGTLPAEVGRILQVSNPTATTCDKTSILENIADITVEKPIQLTTNKITSSYVPLNNDDLVNKLYADNLGVQGPVGPTGATGATGAPGQGGVVLYLNYSESTTPPFLPLNTTQLASIIGGSFTNASITYLPSQNLNTSLLVTTPNLALPQAELTFTINAVATRYPIAQFAIDKIDLTGVDTFINPGIWQMNIYAQAQTNADENKIRLKFYLLARKIIGGGYDNLVPLGSDNLYILDHLAVRSYELNMYIANPIDISIYDLFQVVIIAENINSSPHTSLLYFQSSTTYSHIHTNAGILSNVTLDSVGTGTSLISSNVSPNFYLKSLVGSGISLTNNINEITLTNSLPSTLISLTNSGTGSSILNSTSNPSFSTKGIVAGTNVTITDSGTDLTINSGGGGGTYTFQNGGTGTSLVASTSTITDFKPVSISAGSNVTIGGTLDNLVISSAGSLGTNTILMNSIPTSASLFYPVFASSATGATSTLNSDAGGLTYTPTPNLLTVGAINSGVYTSTIVPPNIGFVGHASSAQKIQTTEITTSASTYYPTFVPQNTSSTSQVVSTDIGLSYTPTPNKLSCNEFSGVTFTSSTVIPAIGFVGASTSSSKVQTFDATTFTSPHFIPFVPLSTASASQEVRTDIALSYTPNTNLLGTVASNYTGEVYTSSRTGLVAGFNGTNSNTLEVAQTNIDTFTQPYYLMMSSSSATSTSLNPSEKVNVDSLLSFIPNTNTLSTATFNGALTGNATTASNINIVGTNQILIQTGTNATSVLAQGTSGQFLRSNGASLPTWENSRGFTQSYGGRITLATGTEYLTPNKWADVTSASIITSSYLTQWRCPISCSITGWSSTVQTTGASQLSILVGGTAGTAITGIGTATSQSGSITARTVLANDLIEIKILNFIAGAVLITLYFS